MKKLLLLIIMVVSTALFASTNVTIGVAELIKGSVKIKNDGSFKKSKLSKGQDIKKGDLITTSKSSTAIIKLLDGSTLVLDASSTLHFKSSKMAQQDEGKIFYKITSRDAKNSLKIKTPFAIIGIKGTTFIVEAGKNSSVKLKEGVVGIQSLKEEYELYRKNIKAEYNKFLSQQESEYQKYKNEQNRGVALMTKEFDLQAKNTIVFDGQKVDEHSWTKEDEADFRRFEKLMKEILKPL